MTRSRSRTYRLALLTALVPLVTVAAILVCVILDAPRAAFVALGSIGSVGTLGMGGATIGHGARHLTRGTSDPPPEVVPGAEGGLGA